MLIDAALANPALTCLGAAAAAGLAWFITHWLGKPIIEIREKRFEALRIADRFAFVSLHASEDLARTATQALNEIAAYLRAHARGQPRLVRAYCHICKYDLEQASGALRGLAAMAGENFSDEVRRNNLNLVYLALNAHQHLTASELSTLRDALAEHEKLKLDAATQ